MKEKKKEYVQLSGYLNYPKLYNDSGICVSTNIFLFEEPDEK